MADLRPLRADEVDQVRQLSFEVFNHLDAGLGLAAYQDSPQRSERGRRRVAHLQRTDPDGAWVLEQDGALVGAALALRRGPLWFLSLLVVRPDQQGAGRGRRLLDAALATAAGAQALGLLASPDPRALRRYRAAGLDLHPAFAARGVLDRSRLPRALGVRAGDWDRDAALVEDVVTAVRGVPYGPDLPVIASWGTPLLVAEQGAERGFAVVGEDGVACLGATTPALAQRLLWAGLAELQGEVVLDRLTGDQQWAVDVAHALRLPLSWGDTPCRRGALGPMTPWIATGVYG